MGIITRIRGMVGGGAEEDTPAYRCQTCKSTFDTAYQVCPSCGAQRVQPIE